MDKRRRPDGPGGEGLRPGGGFQFGDRTFKRRGRLPVEGLSRRVNEGRGGAHPGADERGMLLGMILRMLLMAEGVPLGANHD